MRKVFIFSGQSNMSAYSPLINTRDDAIASPYVPGYARTDGNEWTGAATASINSGYQYRLPTLSANPCLYVENTRGEMDGVFDDWGAYDKEYPQFNLGGAIALGGSYGLELSFLQKFRQTMPSTPLAAIKCSLGGTSMRGDWLPNTVTLGTARAGTSTSITLAAGDFGTQAGYVGRVIRITGGTGAGQTRTISGFNVTTEVADVSLAWSVTPDATSTYGIERLQLQILRTMIEQAAARLDADEPGEWEWGGFLWMHGESGAHSAGTAASDATYLSDSRAFFAFIRSITSASLTTGVGLIGDNWLNTNPYLITAGYPWAAIDYSINGTDGHVAASQVTRDSYLAGAIARRATQTTLGGDANCFSWNNDGYPTRPDYSLTPAATDVTAYHWGGPGNMAAGERAFSGWLAQALPLRRFRIGNLFLQTGI